MSTVSAQPRPGTAKRIIYYNNFASHLLCAYNPNMYYPGLPYRWTDADWRALVDMIARFGFNVFEFWLEPRMFCREALDSELGKEYARQMNVVIDHAHQRGMKAEMIAGLATVGEKWRTLCPNVGDEWREILFLWDAWTRRLPGLDIAGIFPGDPGACSRNGCTAETYIDKSIDVSAAILERLPRAEIDFNTWGPPFFGWGNIHMPPDSHGEFIPEDQSSAWTFSKERADRSMNHLLKRLPDFPPGTAVSINLGFNPDGNTQGEQDARPWARAIAKTNPILTWDFSLTEGENAVYPHYRFSRLFARRKEEREAAAYRGGICFTMTPLLNQLSLYESAKSFLNPDDSPERIAEDFFVMLFGEAGRPLPADYRLFEIIPDWGAYDVVKLPRDDYHRRMSAFAQRLEDLKPSVRADAVFHPTPELYRQELLFFAKLFANLSSPSPDYDALKKVYWDRVYRIYDTLPAHVDPRPHAATDKLIHHFAEWK
ncbi:MAG: hypothetical protein HZB26_20865 [Candidatus Hydrogenedentes bacterium]|nr:hypothetical protein [Candidatus Hydrogenedentota bacterium]